jgi:hypothetical protein
VQEVKPHAVMDLAIESMIFPGSHFPDKLDGNFAVPETVEEIRLGYVPTFPDNVEG